MKKYLLFLSVIFLSIYSIQGQVIFQKSYGINGAEQLYSLIPTFDKAYVSAGSSDTNMCILKTDSNGVKQWMKVIKGPYSLQGNCITQTADSGFAITGTDYSFSMANHSNLLLVKTDKDGNIEWSRTYGDSIASGSNVFGGNWIGQTSDKGYIITGIANNASSSYHIFILKTDSAGVPEWTKLIIGGGCCGQNDAGISIKQLTDGNFILFASKWDYGPGKTSSYFAKIAPGGIILWAREFFSPSSIATTAGAFFETADKGYILTGGSNNTYLAKADSSGNFQWLKQYQFSNNSNGVSVVPTKDSGYAITCNSYNNNLLLLKTANDGTFQWAKSYGDTVAGIYTQGSTVLQTADNGYMVGGIRNGSFYLVKTDSTGNSGCAEAIENPIESAATFIFMGGANEDSVTITVSTLPLLADTNGIENTICFDVDGIRENSQFDPVKVFPNPFSTQTTLETTQHLQNATLAIYNTTGQKVKQLENINGQEIILQRANLPAGLYYFKITQHNQVFSMGKLIVADH